MRLLVYIGVYRTYLLSIFKPRGGTQCFKCWCRCWHGCNFEEPGLQYLQVLLEEVYYLRGNSIYSRCIAAWDAIDGSFELIIVIQSRICKGDGGECIALSPTSLYKHVSVSSASSSRNITWLTCFGAQIMLFDRAYSPSRIIPKSESSVRWVFLSINLQPFLLPNLRSSSRKFLKLCAVAGLLGDYLVAATPHGW